MKKVVFDLDGTLADTEELVRRSYELVGVTVPVDAWGKPASEWLPAIEGDDWHEVHRLKNVAYDVLLNKEGVKELPAAHLCKSLADDKDYDVRILTGASLKAATKVRKSLGLARVPFMSVGATVDMKVALLRAMNPGVYLDDNYDACSRVSDETDWTVLYVQSGSDIDGIVRAYREAETWTQ